MSQALLIRRLLMNITDSGYLVVDLTREDLLSKFPSFAAPEMDSEGVHLVITEMSSFKSQST